MIDGDLCEQFNSLESSKRRNIADELDRTPAEVTYFKWVCTVVNKTFEKFVPLCYAYF